ncbi:histone acetyltransferase subunit NuA4-domain-containing protein [Thelonectria olida]|uniref:Chromatin modification-related protein EAF6 n=1 Tax=Thelonectria olida TaxID=1576542 RepID=A0A9P8WGT0_9HYPO|nr:histone acetyltransferase subunit NuA4-domain-containing protein [Thelonectria olida]
MAENKQGNAAGSGAGHPTMAEYKKAQARVRELVEKRRLLERRLTQVEDGIAQKETTYLESTPAGNIITGFDNYMKGTIGAAAQRRKAGPMEQNKVFSRSSISYRPNNLEGIAPGSGGSTPASHSTPASAAFRDIGSNLATPTSATGKNANKLKKKDKDHEDSENDMQTSKKRTNFGALKK